MRNLGRTDVLKNAGIATLLTGAACQPRLSLWPELEGRVFSSLLVLIWCIFVLWAFVFAWHEEYSGRRPFRFDLPAQTWLLVCGAGLLAAAALRFVADPWLRGVAPWNYPESGLEWTAVALFSVFFGPLFLIFAPFSFFLRLTRKMGLSFVLTVLGSVAVLTLRFVVQAGRPSAVELAALSFFFAAQAVVVLALYLRGGAFAVWALLLLLEARHLPDCLPEGAKP